MKISKAIIVIAKEVKVFRKRKDAADYLGMTDNGLKIALQRNNNDYYRQDGTRIVISEVECPGNKYIRIKGTPPEKNEIEW